MNILRAERDDVQNKARICEWDLMVLCKDHCCLQASFGRLTLRFINLQARISEEHPDFQLIRVQDCGASFQI